MFPDSPEMQSPTCEACTFALYVNVKLHSVLCFCELTGLKLHLLIPVPVQQVLNKVLND